MLKTSALNGSFKTKKHVILELLEPPSHGLRTHNRTKDGSSVAPYDSAQLQDILLVCGFVGLAFGDPHILPSGTTP